jgi:acyl-CoA synthetase (AMP-forming)/AMP-acid ligase II
MWRHPEIRTLPDIVEYWAARTPDRVVIRAGEAALTWDQLWRQVQDLAGPLAACGEPDAPVAYLGHNSVEFWVAWFASNLARRPYIPLNWRLAGPELVALLDDARPALVVVQETFADLVGPAVAETGDATAIWTFTPTSAGGVGLEPWRARADPPCPTRRPTGEDIALIAYTSGTTGSPKGALHRHEAFDLAALSDDLEPTIVVGQGDTHLMAMPNFHLAGSWVSIPVLYHGGTLVTVPAFDPAVVLAAIERHRPTTLCLVPTAIQWLVGAVRSTAADVSSLRTLIYAGSPISAPTVKAALDTLGCELRQFYGTTETYIITILRPADHDPGRPELIASCGSPIPLVDIKITDLQGVEVPGGTVGEVLVRSPMGMAGYLGKPDGSNEILCDGWYRTGDLGFRSAEGQLTLVDRVKDMVVTGGENVYSVEVERAIQSHADVAMVAVVGVPDERWGEAVTAYVVPVAGHTIDPEAIREHCRSRIAGYKVPKAVHVRDALPLTPSGKIRKVDLRTSTHI